jgi:glutamyl-tRNA reductase
VQLLITGVHQRTAPIALRERLAFGPSHTGAALQSLRGYVEEGFIVSTCNRVEIYGLIADSQNATPTLPAFLADWHAVAPEELAPYLYTFTGDDAVRHLFRLAAGLESMVLGEDQIQLQLKAALTEAHQAGAAGRLIHRLLHSALAAGKLIRTRTGIARSPTSVVSVALELARNTLGGLASRHVLVIGAGRMAELALKHLRSDAPQTISIVNRTNERAQALADAYGATAWPVAQLEQALCQADVVISCTASPQIVVTSAMITRALAARPRELLLLDLAVPRDVDRRVAQLPGVRLFDIDDMRAICETNRAARAAEVAAAEALVEGEVAKFMEWWAAQKVVPTIQALRAQAEAIRVAEIERTLAKLPELSSREQDAIQALSTAIINKLLHQPIIAMKDPAAGDQSAQAVRTLFQLSETMRESHATES